ncbi:MULTISPECIES: RNA-binding domain-containing protein [Alcaligenes]|uniref:RNA-binding domain-containing protein n=1 Tax=Alcaligenes TaxID=507 RepID=UPI002BBAC375|nr:RNA-binding domain-containing protein [Alcaligenes phenolicus]HRO19019.1 putative DNA binding domain-containing protein [Alcaligenes phenolicus]HRP14856.1 putative DNA binding domain-containing protein [Alcaligenes phenolicus]
METTELIDLLSRGEDSRHQFKENFTNADALAAEIVAFSNTVGEKIFIGVRNNGSVLGLSGEDIDRLNQLVSNSASQNVRPAVNPLTENVPHPNGTVMVVTVAEGVSKPYMDKNGAIWVKNGSDKRRATSREEIQRLFQQAGLVHADETPVAGLGVGDVDMSYFEVFFEQQFGEPLSQHNQPLPQFALPAFIVKAVAFVGNEIEDQRYIDSRDITGKLADVFQQALGFIVANTRAAQSEQGFNSQGQSEIPRIVWEELVANALIHRDYFISAPVRVLVFADRVEIISPGHLPNNLTIENIKAGNSNMRNPILASFAAKLLPYRGLGSGLLRALRAWLQIELINDRAGNLFKAVVVRPQEQAT